MVISFMIIAHEISPFGKFRLKGVVPMEQSEAIGKDLWTLGKDRLI